MAVYHIVSLKFAPGTPAENIVESLNGVAGLQKSCIHPTTNLPYIKSFVAGRNTVPKAEYTHTFIMEFDSVEDREYYMNLDPAHAAFTKVITTGEFPLGGAQIMSFSAGDY
ncbi:hypothetical protein Q9L58_007727 [Maublancomyces gigas]|uniref:Stress-response A/B barrel domain-containing protein n=1 Tax=Discina gigas TaxID=1032678 RepID=A0ABR3GBS8_9PEZI